MEESVVEMISWVCSELMARLGGFGGREVDCQVLDEAPSKNLGMKLSI